MPHRQARGPNEEWTMVGGDRPCGGGRKDEQWQFELHLCTGVARSCKQGRPGRGLDFHSDRFRHAPLGDLADHKVDWLKKNKCKKYVDEEVSRMAAPLPTRKGSGSHEGGAGLDFEEARLPAPDASDHDPALKGLHNLEQELAAPKVGKKKRQQVDPRGRVWKSARKRKRKEGRRGPATAEQGLPQRQVQARASGSLSLWGMTQRTARKGIAAQRPPGL